MASMSREEYVRYLVASQINHTQTYMGEHREGISHDKINRFMREAKIRPRHLWHAVRAEVISSDNGYLLFDDTTINKEHSEKIEIAKAQYSGSKHGIVTGISVVTCVYYNPELKRHWIIDYRIYDMGSDGRTKLDHVKDMLEHTIDRKKLPFLSVLFDTWYATLDMMKFVHGLKKIFYCPIKPNRHVMEDLQWKKVEDLEWNKENLAQGRDIYLKGQGKDLKLRLHRIERNTPTEEADFEYIATNDIELRDSEAVAKHAGFRWKIEELHREAKQTTGLERCQCRKARPQRNHIGCAFIAWVALKRAAHHAKTTIYQLKRSMLDSYMYYALNYKINLLINW
jgi:hypothetical protein